MSLRLFDPTKVVTVVATFMAQKGGRKLLRNTKITFKSIPSGPTALAQAYKWLDLIDATVEGVLAYASVKIGAYVQDAPVPDMGNIYNEGLIILEDPSNLGLKQYITIPFADQALGQTEMDALVSALIDPLQFNPVRVVVPARHDEEIMYLSTRNVASARFTPRDTRQFSVSASGQTPDDETDEMLGHKGA